MTAKWKQLTDDAFIKLASESRSMKDFMYKLGYKSASGSSRIPVKQRCIELGVPIPQMSDEERVQGAKLANTIPDDEYFVQGVERKGTSLKQRLIQKGYCEERCAICGQGPEWQHQPLSLQVDHINGDHFDNRITNLRLLCPNCHSQTKTFGSKNIAKES